MKRNLKKDIYTLLLGSTMFLTSCSNKNEILNNNERISITDVVEDINYDSGIILNEDIKQISNDNNLNDIEVNKILITKNVVNFRTEMNLDSEIIDVLPANLTIDNYQKVNDEWYKVNINDIDGYVSSSLAKEKIIANFNYNFINTIYLKDKKTLYIDEELTEELVELENLEFCEVYDETDDYYLVKTNDVVGYISKDNTEELSGTFVVVDISDQILKMYKDGEVVLETPVVTGKPSSPTPTGLYSDYNESRNRYLVGPGYRSYIDVMAKFIRNIGLHDAEYHTHEDGFSHGWRSSDAFGGEIYLTNGSHGCVNMPHDAAIYVYDNLEIGDKVLVKR